MQSTEVVTVEDEDAPAVPVSTKHDQVDAQIATAHRFPRSVKAFRAKAMSMATFSEEVALGCFYVVPRDGKQIEGPSIRLAEIAASAWGNLRIEAGVIDEGEKMLTSEGVCWDLETNVAVKKAVKRRITKKNGARYSDDMIATTGNAANSIAMRNAILAVIPKVYIDEIYHQCRKVAIGNAETLVKRRGAMLEHFAKLGISQERVCAYIGKPSVDDLGLDDLFVLRGVANAIKDGATSIDEAFPTAPAKENVADLQKRLETSKPKQ